MVSQKRLTAGLTDTGEGGGGKLCLSVCLAFNNTIAQQVLGWVGVQQLQMSSNYKYKNAIDQILD